MYGKLGESIGVFTVTKAKSDWLDLPLQVQKLSVFVNFRDQTITSELWRQPRYLDPRYLELFLDTRLPILNPFMGLIWACPILFLYMVFNMGITHIKPIYGRHIYGLPYMVHQYMGHPCMGHPYMGHPYMGHPYMGHPYMGHPYMGHPYMDHHMCHSIYFQFSAFVAMVV